MSGTKPLGTLRSVRCTQWRLDLQLRDSRRASGMVRIIQDGRSIVTPQRGGYPTRIEQSVPIAQPTR